MPEFPIVRYGATSPAFGTVPFWILFQIPLFALVVMTGLSRPEAVSPSM